MKLIEYCPKCGSDDLFKVDSELKLIPSFDYNLPDSYDISEIKIRCGLCGHLETIGEYQPDYDSMPGGNDYRKDKSL